jgi:hypothetical protein
MEVLKNIRYHQKKFQNVYPFVQNDFHVYHLAHFIDWCLKNGTCFPYGIPWKGQSVICFTHKLARWGGVHVDNMKGLGTFTNIFKMKSLIIFYKMTQTWKNTKNICFRCLGLKSPLVSLVAIYQLGAPSRSIVACWCWFHYLKYKCGIGRALYYHDKP